MLLFLDLALEESRSRGHRVISHPSCSNTCNAFTLSFGDAVSLYKTPVPEEPITSDLEAATPLGHDKSLPPEGERLSYSGLLGSSCNWYFSTTIRRKEEQRSWERKLEVNKPNQ